MNIKAVIRGGDGIFPESRKTNSKILLLKLFFLLYPLSLNIICFIEKNNIFLSSVCVFSRVTLLKLIVPPRILEKVTKFLKI